MDQLKVPEAVRVRLGNLYKAQNDAIARLPEVAAWQQALSASLEWLGLDASVQGYTIDFASGVITLPLAPPGIALVKGEQAS